MFLFFFTSLHVRENALQNIRLLIAHIACYAVFRTLQISYGFAVNKVLVVTAEPNIVCIQM